MRNLLIRLAWWLLRKLGALPNPEIVLVARELCFQQERRSAPGTSDEYKRHQVYAALQKRFPDTRKRVLSRAIDDAL